MGVALAAACLDQCSHLHFQLFALPLELEVLIHQATNLLLQLLHVRPLPRPGAERRLPVLHHPDVLALVVAVAATAAVAAAGPGELQIQAAQQVLLLLLLLLIAAAALSLSRLVLVLDREKSELQPLRLSCGLLGMIHSLLPSTSGRVGSDWVGLD